METKHFVVDRNSPDRAQLSEAAVYIKAGALVAFPTETVYGLGADGLNAAAVERIYAAKGRPSDNPLILHIADRQEVARLAVSIPANAEVLMETFWPGPLTVILERAAIVPDRTTGGLDTVAIRLPDSSVARELIRLAGTPLAAPSANISGRPSPTNAADVLADLAGKIAAVVDAGDCAIGVESTIVDCTTPVPTLLRPGGITLEQLLATLGEVEVDTALAAADAAPRAPGMKYTHYAPKVPMTLLEVAPAEAVPVLLRELAGAEKQGLRAGVVAFDETLALLPDKPVKASLGCNRDAGEAAARLYTVLRYFDDKPVDVIYAEGVSEQGLGLAVMNRLRKASGYRIIKK